MRIGLYIRTMLTLIVVLLVFIAASHFYTRRMCEPPNPMCLFFALGLNANFPNYRENPILFS